MTMMSAEVDKIFSALCKAQKEMKVAPKESNNPYFKSKYADLQTVWETVKTPLCNNGLCVSQVLNEQGENSLLITILAHESGQWIKSVTPLKMKPIRVNKDGSIYEANLTPQEVCAAVTYFRRMSLSAITGCYAGEADDDGETASGKKEGKSPSEPKSSVEPISPTLAKDQIETLKGLLKDRPDLREEVLKLTGKKLIGDIEYSKFQEVMKFIERILKKEGAA